MAPNASEKNEYYPFWVTLWVLKNMVWSHHFVVLSLFLAVEVAECPPAVAGVPWVIIGRN